MIYLAKIFIGLSIVMLISSTPFNLNGMARCRLGYSALDYNGYGCFCGLGGSGSPVDGIDECCRLHDNCYGQIQSAQICPDVYKVPISYTCSNNDPICAPDQDSCKAALCQCDRAVVECWSRFGRPRDKVTCSSGGAAQGEPQDGPSLKNPQSKSVRTEPENGSVPVNSQDVAVQPNPQASFQQSIYRKASDHLYILPRKLRDYVKDLY